MGARERKPKPQWHTSDTRPSSLVGASFLALFFLRDDFLELAELLDVRFLFPGDLEYERRVYLMGLWSRLIECTNSNWNKYMAFSLDNNRLQVVFPNCGFRALISFWFLIVSQTNMCWMYETHTYDKHFAAPFDTGIRQTHNINNGSSFVH